MSTVLVPYEDFLVEVLPYVRDVPEFVAVNAIRNACIEFCENSLYWREVLPDIEIVSGQAEYDVDTQLGASIAMIVTARIGRHHLKPEATESLDEKLGADWRTREGATNFITQDNASTVRLACVPGSTYEDPLTITAALRPDRGSAKVGRAVFERYAEVIGHGARARLHNTSGQPYSDPQEALKFRRWFETGYGEAKIAINRGLGRTNLVVRPPRI